MTAKIDMHPIIKEVLVECGWTPFGGPAIAVKSFDTAVGAKEAVAWLSKGDEYNRTLSGDYHSEGRNALEACGVLIPVDADADTVRRLAQQFVEKVDSTVVQTYAAKLRRSAP